MRIGVTRREFAERSRAAQKSEKRFSFVWGLVFFSVLIGNWLYLEIADPDFPNSIWILYGAVLFAFLLVNIPFTMYMARKVQRDSGMECSICLELLDKDAAALAVTTGNCVHCSQKFLTD